MMKRRFRRLIIAAALGLGATSALADEPPCGGPRVSEDAIFNADPDETKGVALEEHQILFVKDYRYVVGNWRSDSTSNRTGSNVALFITGSPSPSTEVERLVIEFKHPAEDVTSPSYLVKEKLIQMNMPLTQFPVVEKILTACAQIYAQYRRYSNGHTWADLHMSEIPVGPDF